MNVKANTGVFLSLYGIGWYMMPDQHLYRHNTMGNVVEITVATFISSDYFPGVKFRLGWPGSHGQIFQFFLVENQTHDN